MAERGIKRRRGPREGLAHPVRRESDLADHLGEMISAHAPDGTYRYASAAAKDLLGYEPSQLVGRWSYEYFHPDDVPKVGVAHRSALNGAPFTVAYRIRRSSGDYVWVETTNRIICDDRGEVTEILCCTRALSDRAATNGAAQEEHEARLQRVHKVLGEESITLVFQPIIDLQTGRVIAYEALSRFPGNPAHTPDRWFADAWQVGLGVPLELLAVRLAARALPRLPPDVGLCVNASPPAVAAEGFLQSLGDQVHRVAVEVTEHLQVDDYSEVGARLSSLRDAGGQVAIDDFGAGYASLRHILAVRPEWIKLDISLTECVADSPVAHALAVALVSFAETIGIKVIAEGIENVEQLEALTGMGIRYGQGFHIGKPAALDEALAARAC